MAHYEISIDKNSGVPAYRQVIEKITLLVRNGKLNPGDKLPPERDLAEKLKIARGTIKKAYEELARSNIIEVIQGRGSFISSKQDVISESRMERAVNHIDKLLTELENLKFSYREIKNLIDLKIIEREERRENFYIAAIDCNPESLSIYEKQIGFISRVKITKFLLDELTSSSESFEKLKNFELILTTATHYTELLGMFPEIKEKIIQVIVSPSQASIINLASITSAQKIGIICESKRFLQIIKDKLKDFKIPASNVSHLFIKDESILGKFLKDKNVVIVPPGYSLQNKKEHLVIVQNFMENGGKIIQFDYQIERGSLLYIEERIKSLLNR